MTDGPASSAAPATATPNGDQPEPSVELSPAEADAVSDVVIAYLRAVPVERRGPYVELLDQVTEGHGDGARVTGPAVTTLEQVCAVSLETGRARQIGTAEVEGHVAAVFRRTPEGTARLSRLRDVNAALSRLKGEPLTNAQFSSQRPGRYTLSLGVPGFAVSLVITPAGVELSSLSTG